MRKLLISFLVISGALHASAQGMFNGDTDASQILQFGKCYEYNGGAPGVVPLGPTSRGQWYIGAGTTTDDSLLLPVGSPGQFQNGYFRGGNYTTTFAGGTTVTLQLRAWHLDAGATWEAQLANPAGFSGKSSLVQLTLSTSPISVPPVTGFVGFTLAPNVPEPSTIVLGVMGMAMLLRCGHKQS